MSHHSRNGATIWSSSSRVPPLPVALLVAKAPRATKTTTAKITR